MLNSHHKSPHNESFYGAHHSAISLPVERNSSNGNHHFHIALPLSLTPTRNCPQKAMTRFSSLLHTEYNQKFFLTLTFAANPSSKNFHKWVRDDSERKKRKLRLLLMSWLNFGFSYGEWCLHETVLRHWEKFFKIIVWSGFFGIFIDKLLIFWKLF